ncbi:hypothetical protein [Nocardioides sp.]|uniref:hypothetical protein n=1 Tax=Nocardioides sp. TaxID=35761 RepID=UPI00271B4500|nr:hypothetical protein [Nocardioides sp.]MDO9457501.1 hypothetical protein [Nocardioides sp.]
MAGGMNQRGRGLPLSERTTGPPAPDPCPMRHCWVADAADGQGVKRPGLLVEWRPAATGWEGRVVYAAQVRPGGWLTVEEWLPAALLTPL